MNFNKPNREELKRHFKKNAIPTEGDFFDLIDGMINQKDDGIAKVPHEPLSLQADGDGDSEKKVINFYKNFADDEPAWTLSLNPRSNPADPDTANPGLSIGDSHGKTALFIDETTGNIGVGTVEPGEYNLKVDGVDGSGFFKKMTVSTMLEVGTGPNAAPAVPRTELEERAAMVMNIRGTAYMEGALIASSDLRLKKDVSVLRQPTEHILKLRGVRFKWLNDADIDPYAMGLIAQEVEDVFPEAVATGPDGMKGINYSALLAPLIETVKQQQVQIDDLHAEIKAMREGDAATKR